jgi:phosphoribosyl-AMP cyclohydrolase / phosphoribosyl-ATP pyrophosphohydrolase
MTINFAKGDGLVPVIIQQADTAQVLMLGYMDEAAFLKTQEEGRVTFFSRSKNRLWTKGESSGNFLQVVTMLLDCDADTLLIKVRPTGATCHTGRWSCFEEQQCKGYLYTLEETIQQRIADDEAKSYTASLVKRGINKVAQKVGEEAVELVIEAKDDNRDLFLGEAADLLYHLLILLQAKKVSLSDVENVLLERSRKS